MSSSSADFVSVFYTLMVVLMCVHGLVNCDRVGVRKQRHGIGAPVLVYNDDGLKEFSPGFEVVDTEGGGGGSGGGNARARSRRSVEDNETTNERYDVEITVLVDFSLFHWFWEGTSEPNRRNKTIDSIRFYYANIIQGADLRYAHLRREGLDINLRLTAYLIIEDQRRSFFTENLWVRDGLKSRRRRVNSIKALVALRYWDIGKNLSLLARSDHVMAFTRYNLYKLTSDRRNIKDHGVGIAFAESICTMESYSLIEEKGGFRSEGVAAHEIGHRVIPWEFEVGSHAVKCRRGLKSGQTYPAIIYDCTPAIIVHLGAFHHDGESGSTAAACSADDLFVMAPVNKLARHWNIDNPYMFSPCSIRQIRRYLSKYEKSWCLKNEGHHVKDWESSTSILPGQYMAVHEQCEHRTSNGSQLCGFHRENICQDLWCTVPSRDGGCVTTGPAARGTTCQNKKICIRGKCTEHADAPEASEYCLHGDHPSALTSRYVPCSAYINPHPARCYTQAVNYRCCHSCYQHQLHDRPDCSYGDNRRWCSNVSRYRCADPMIKWQCCKRCARRPFRCRDNRRFRLHGFDCDTLIMSFGKRSCYSNQVARQCCRTCRRYRNHMDPNCMFGDRFRYVYRNSRHPYGYDCRQVATDPETYCQVPHVRTDCCGTCAFY